MDTSPGQSAGSGSEFIAGQQVGQGRFELVQELGRGGMGVVWLARDTRLGELVALKFLPREIGTDPVAIQDMRRETLKSRKLSHPNIIRIYDLFESPGEAPFISMEYIDGSNLNAIRITQPQYIFSWEYLKPLVEQMCDALDYAHSEKTVHRDIKPGNMMLDRNGRLKLADFGIAASISDTMSRTSLRYASSGTLAYMSPQQMDGEVPKVTDDIYALGATLYELLTSRPPFYTGDVAHQVRNLPPRPIDERLAELELTNPVPREEAAMVMACLSKDPAKRPQNAARVAEWVGLHVRRRRTAAAPVASSEADDGSSPTDSADYIQPFGAFRVKRSLFYLGVATLVLVIVGITAGFIFSKRTLDGGSTQSDTANAGTPAPTETTGNNTAAASATTTSPSAKTATTTPAENTAGKLIDLSFDPGDGPSDILQTAVLQPDGKIIIAGRFDQVGKDNSKRIARLNPDGSQDVAFRANAGANDTVIAVALQPDGKILLGGNFTQYKGAPHTRIMRINANGTADATFKAGKGADAGVQTFALQSDGKILIGGFFKTINGVSRRSLARLNSNGSLDTTFNIGSGFDSDVRDIAIQKDGKILICGYFTTFNGEPAGRVARLNPDGSLDKSFAVGAGANAPVVRVTLLPDDKILFNGAYSKFNGEDLINFIRLNPDGTRDTSFTLKSGANDSAWSFTPLPGGRLLMAGTFIRAGGKSFPNLAILNADGSVDESFRVEFSRDATVYTAFVQPDGKIVVAGKFSTVDGVRRPYIARLKGP